MIELFNTGMPVVRTDGQAYGHVITKFSRMGRLPYFLTHGATLRALRARELRYKTLTRTTDTISFLPERCEPPYSKLDIPVERNDTS